MEVIIELPSVFLGSSVLLAFFTRGLGFGAGAVIAVERMSVSRAGELSLLLVMVFC